MIETIILSQWEDLSNQVHNQGENNLNTTIQDSSKHIEETGKCSQFYRRNHPKMLLNLIWNQNFNKNCIFKFLMLLNVILVSRISRPQKQREITFLLLFSIWSSFAVSTSTKNKTRTEKWWAIHLICLLICHVS